MSQELRRAALRGLTQPVDDERERARLLYKALAGGDRRVRGNATLSRLGQPQAADDVHLVALDGATTVRKGDGVGTNLSRQLVRPPLKGQQGGRTTRHVLRQETKLKDFLAVVVSKTDNTTYQCKLLNETPPGTTDPRTGKDVIRDQTIHNAAIIADAANTPTAEQVTVQVYGDTEVFSYAAGDVIEVKQEIQYQNITAYIRRDADRAANAVTARSASFTRYYHTRYEMTGGG